MITGPLKNQVDSLWLAFHTGGITNPLTVIEQISFLIFLKLLDVNETRSERQSRRTGKPMRSVFGDDQELRWSSFKQLGGEERLPLVRDRVFKHLRELGSTDGERRTTWQAYMADAQLMIQRPSLLSQAIDMVDALPLERGDTKGDIYEYLLSKLTTAGINGQFRTPRHVIRLMVELVAPRPDETIADPACGTAGFLVGAMQYLLERHTSPEGRMDMGVDERGNPQVLYTGDGLEPYREHVQNRMFHGFDFDVTMLRIAAMNLMLHGVESPAIHYRDTLSSSFPEAFAQYAAEAFDVVLANPPFKGSLDFAEVEGSLLRRVKTRKTELLFVALILRMLKKGGRSATIVPDGVLFGSSGAHVALRRYLVDDNQLEGVISLPSGVFKPYAGVSTAILVFTKGGRTGDVFFYDVERDGYSLDDKRTPASDRVGALGPTKDNDLPAVVEAWGRRGAGMTDRASACFVVPREEIEGNKYDLSINRYKRVVHAEEQHEDPREILRRLRELERGIEEDIAVLEGMLG